MKRNSVAILILLAFFALVIGLNFVFFIDERAAEETEANADRSSYRSTPYGTKAFYTLLQESGYQVTHFEKPFTELKQSDPGTLIIIAPPAQNEVSEEELASLMKWLEGGGLSIVIDHDVHIPFGDANVETEPANLKQGARVLQPTDLTRGVQHVSLSTAASRVRIFSKAVTYHIGVDQAAILADIPVGKGRAVFLTDPHIVANNGLPEQDNLVLALNLLAERPKGKIAFDEFHHGYGASGAGGGFLSYFRGTPVPWMFWQIVLISALVVYTLGRRFGRPIPLRRERRTTNLEFVSSMGNITRLARAGDLAMQNVYTEFRKRLCRAVGLPTRVESPKLAAAAARRTRTEEREMRSMMARCEAIVQGKEVGDAELLSLVTRIREIEAELKL